MAEEKSSVELLKEYLDKSGTGEMEFWLFILTCALVATKFVLLPKDNIIEKGSEIIMKGNFATIIYFCILVSLAGYFNFVKYKKRCCENYPDTPCELESEKMYFIFMISFFPWVSIMGLCFAVLNLLPGWKAPFSNTFGYFITMFMLGGQRKFNKILILNTDTNIKNILESNFTNLINDYTPNNINELEHLAGNKRLGTETMADAHELYTEIAKLILLKDYISESIWFILMGLFVINISNNYISVNACQ